MGDGNERIEWDRKGSSDDGWSIYLSTAMVHRASRSPCRTVD